MFIKFTYVDQKFKKSVNQRFFKVADSLKRHSVIWKFVFFTRNFVETLQLLRFKKGLFFSEQIHFWTVFFNLWRVKLDWANSRQFNLRIIELRKKTHFLLNFSYFPAISNKICHWVTPRPAVNFISWKRFFIFPATWDRHMFTHHI